MLCVLCGTKQPEHKEHKEKYSTKFTKWIYANTRYIFYEPDNSIAIEHDTELAIIKEFIT